MTEIDFTDTIKAKSDQLNAADIADEMTITLTKGEKKLGNDQPVTLHYEGDNGRPWKPCLSMRRVLARAWGSKVDVSGRQVTLICDSTVKWAGEEVGGIRIKALSHIDKEMSIPLRASKHVVKKYVIEAIKTAPPELIKAGDDAAKKGSDAYKKWLNDLGDDKPLVKSHHSNWSKIAKEVDSEADDTPVL